MLQSDGSAWYFKDGKFNMICMREFKGSSHGVNLFCQKLGYDNGFFVRKGGVAETITSIRIGKCSAGDKNINNCTGGGNTYKVGGDCGPNSPAKFTVTCRGGKLPRMHSCAGE